MGVGFEAFVAWYDGARQKGGALSKKGDTAVQKKLRASRDSRASRESKEDIAASFNLALLQTGTKGEPQTLEYRVNLLMQPDEGVPLQISPWHDVPLYPPGGKERSEVRIACSSRSVEMIPR